MASRSQSDPVPDQNRNIQLSVNQQGFFPVGPQQGFFPGNQNMQPPFQEPQGPQQNFFPPERFRNDSICSFSTTPDVLPTKRPASWRRARRVPGFRTTGHAMSNRTCYVEQDMLCRTGHAMSMSQTMSNIVCSLEYIVAVGFFL